MIDVPTLCPMSKNSGAMYRMWLTEKTGFIILRCFECALPVKMSLSSMHGP